MGRGLLEGMQEDDSALLQNRNKDVVQLIGTKDSAADMFHLVAVMEDEEAGPNGPLPVRRDCAGREERLQLSYARSD